MLLPTKLKEAIKTALAMTITYGIALSLDWDRPKWAAFAVAMISLATIGLSLNKAAMRMLGTFVAVSVALFIIALTPQERWHFILLLSVYIGFCTYMMSGEKHSYFWMVSGFVCAIICFNAGPNSENAFNIAMLRAQETGLGILVYSLIAMLIWPVSSRNELFAIAQKLGSTQHQLLHTYFQLLNDPAKTKEALQIRLQEVQTRSKFGDLLNAAETDSEQVKDMREQWRLYQVKTGELIEVMEQLRSSFILEEALDLNSLFPNLDEFQAEMHRRLVEIDQIWGKDVIEHYPSDISLEVEHHTLDTLSNLQKATLTLLSSQFQRLNILTHDLFYIVRDIKECNPNKKPINTVIKPRLSFILDTDRLAYAFRVILIIWLAYLSVIYVGDIPGKFTIVTIATIFGMTVSTMPQISIWLLFKPAMLGIAFAGFIYIFLMPQMSSFIELGPMIFGVTFIICYLFSTPKQALGRVYGLAMFILVIGIDNQQSYSFLSVANTALMFPLVFMIFSVTTFFPISWRAKDVFQKLLERYFRSCAYVMSTVFEPPKPQNSFLRGYNNIFHKIEIIKLPHSLNSWVKRIDTKTMPGVSSENIQTLVNSLQALTLRIQELQKISIDPQTHYLAHELQNELQIWHQKLKEALHELSKNPAAEKQVAFRSKLNEIIEYFEQHVELHLDRTDASQFSKEDSENFYLLLGAYRSVSEALIDYTSKAEEIDWAQWRKEQFA